MRSTDPTEGIAMTSRGGAETARSATGPKQGQDARQAELYAAMGKVNIQALWTQVTDLTPGEPWDG
jgi:hypothetical protein